MALDDRRLTKEQRIAIEGTERFEELLRGAVNDPWWREFIRHVELRRMSFLNAIVEGFDDQRQEDRIRGRINELSFFVALDTKGKQMIEEKGEPNNGRSV